MNPLPLTRMLVLAGVEDPWRGNSPEHLHEAWEALYEHLGGDAQRWAELRRVALAGWRAARRSA